MRSSCVRGRGTEKSAEDLVGPPERMESEGKTGLQLSTHANALLLLVFLSSPVAVAHPSPGRHRSKKVRRKPVASRYASTCGASCRAICPMSFQKAWPTPSYEATECSTPAWLGLGFGLGLGLGLVLGFGFGFGLGSQLGLRLRLGLGLAHPKP